MEEEEDEIEEVCLLFTFDVNETGFSTKHQFFVVNDQIWSMAD